MDEEFADNKVIVVFNKEESNKLRDYRVEDFSELSVTKVIDLTQNTKAILQAVRYDTESSNLQAASLETRQFISENYNQIITLELKTPGKENVLAAIKKLASRDDILYAGPDYKIHAASTSTDDPDRMRQWAPDVIDLYEAWDITTGSDSVTVGIIDSGIDGNHEDLSDNVNSWLSREFQHGTTQTVTTPTDPGGHGTFVAGIIGACGNNGIGIIICI